MKTTLCLTLLCLIFGVRSRDHAHHAHKENEKFTFSSMEEQLCDMKKSMDDQINSVLDEGRESGMEETCEAILDDLEESVCYNPSAYSDTCADDLYFGCSCMSAFSKQEGVCAEVPCQVIQYLKRNIVGILKTFRDDVNTMEGFMELMINKLYNPFLQMACPCFPGLTDATFQCIRQYDALVIKPYQEIYQTAVSMFDLDTLKSLVDTVMTAYCVEVEGELCHVEFGEMMLTYGRMFDNTFDEDHQDQCSSWMRIEGGLARYLRLSSFTKSNKKVMKAARKLMKEAMCDPSCQEHMADTFYSCCAKKAHQIAQEGELSENIGIMMENLKFAMSMLQFDTDDMSMDSSIMQQVQADFHPEVECQMRGRENFYEKIAEDCDMNA